jgi:hypothetical protein
VNQLEIGIRHSFTTSKKEEKENNAAIASSFAKAIAIYQSRIEIFVSNAIKSGLVFRLKVLMRVKSKIKVSFCV